MLNLWDAGVQSPGSSLFYLMKTAPLPFLLNQIICLLISTVRSASNPWLKLQPLLFSLFLHLSDSLLTASGSLPLPPTRAKPVWGRILSPPGNVLFCSPVQNLSLIHLSYPHRSQNPVSAIAAAQRVGLSFPPDYVLAAYAGEFSCLVHV